MLKFKRMRWLPILALAAAVVLSAGCGGDDDDDDDNGGGGGDGARAGTWLLSFTSTLTGPEGCEGTSGPFELPFVLCGLDDPGDLIDDGEDNTECEQSIEGNVITFSCTSTEVVGDCVIVTEYSGTASFTETTFMMNATLTESTTSSDEACQLQVDECTTVLVINGTWQSSSGAGECDDEKGELVPFGTTVRRAGRLLAP
jgi:hypothetical protein